MKAKIAVFTTGWSGEILSQFISGMTNALKEEQADVFLFLCYPTYIDSPEIKQGELNIHNLPDMRDFDCSVIFGSGMDFKERVDLIIKKCNEADVPVIMQGARRDGVSFVGSDNYQATKDMCEHLRSYHGVKTVSFFAGSKDSHDSELRLKAVRDYLQEHDPELDLLEVLYTNWENAAVTRHIDDLVRRKATLPDAIICANDGLAMETCVSLDRNGYNVPGDVLVCGYDYLDDGKVFDPSIASVDQCFVEMGEAAMKLRKELKARAKRDITEIIPCKFIPGDSCNCKELRNSDSLRRKMGREAFSNRAMTTYFNRKLDVIDTTILSCHSYEEFKNDLHRLLVENHDFEGDSFHILLEPSFGASIYDDAVEFNIDSYSDKMEVLYSTEDGVSYEEETFSSCGLIPGYTGDKENHLYVFLPLHEADRAYGYIVFRDCLDKVVNRFLRTYQNRMCLVFEKFRYAITIDLINKRLIDIMRRDPLTGVNNRMAYEDKEKQLQELIDKKDSDKKFAIAMFDANSLKLINDTQGHEAGDAYLIRTCGIICEIFAHSPVYRIGGDEFVAILTGEDYRNLTRLEKEFNSMLSPYTDKTPIPQDYVSVACGISAFDPATDKVVADVINRADEQMYKDKARKKQK